MTDRIEELKKLCEQGNVRLYELHSIASAIPKLIALLEMAERVLRKVEDSGYIKPKVTGNQTGLHENVINALQSITSFRKGQG